MYDAPDGAPPVASAVAASPGRHDIRNEEKGCARCAGTPSIVHATYQLADVTDDQMGNVVDALRQLELERGERIRNAKTEATGDGVVGRVD